MNVSISQLVADFHTTVTTIQAVIALYSLVMAVLMIPGGKMGDILGRRRAFTIGLCIYGTGSLITAISGSVAVLMFGWSLLEGIGAALVLPALVALTARSFEGPARALAYGVLGRRLGRGNRGRPDPRRLDDDQPLLALRVRRGGRDRPWDPRLRPLPARGQGPRRGGPRPDRRAALWLGAGADRVRRAPGRNVGLASPARLADHPVRLLADPVRDRGRRRAALRIQGVGAPQGGRRARNHWSISACSRSSACARACRPSWCRT